MRKTQYFPFKGALNTESSALGLSPGELIDVLNYEARTKGGYRRIDGYERWDGQALPSDAIYYTVAFTGGVVEPAAGDIVEGDSSGATGEVLAVVVDSGSWASSDAAGYVAVLVLSGAFISGEDLIGVFNVLYNPGDLTTTSWGKVGVTCTSTSIIEDTGTSRHSVLSLSGFVNEGLTYLFSVTAKAGTATCLQIFGHSASFGTSAYANFDLDAGVVGSKGSGCTSDIEDLGSGVYKCSMTCVCSASGIAQNMLIALTNNSSTSARWPTYEGASKTLEVYTQAVSSLLFATSSAAQASRGESDETLDALYISYAVEAFRDLITEIPGSGPIRGVWMYNGVGYAFRDNAGATACLMYKSTAAGWVVVTTPALLPGGRYEFITTNFYGSTDTIKMYGVDGVNKGFEFDGTTYTEISTGMTTDTPSHVAVHKKHLFFSYTGGSVQHSGIGTPGTWTPITGAGEISIGEEVTGFVVTADTLVIFGRNGIYPLYGSSSADWNLATLSSESGAIEWTVQGLSSPTYLDDRGVTNLQAVQAYGDFNTGTISQKVKKVVDAMNPYACASLRVREKDQYRLFSSDGRCLFVSLDGSKIVGSTLVDYGMTIRCAASIEDSDGQEVLLAGSDTGYVYRMDSGLSFDGDNVAAWIRPAFNHFKTPENVKRFFKVTLEITATGPVSLIFLPEFDYSSTSVPSFEYVTVPTADYSIVSDVIGGGIWDGVDTEWDRFYWDAQIVGAAEGRIDGVGRNMSLLIRSQSSTEQPHTIQGAVIHYSPRGIKR